MSNKKNEKRRKLQMPLSIWNVEKIENNNKFQGELSHMTGRVWSKRIEYTYAYFFDFGIADCESSKSVSSHNYFL